MWALAVLVVLVSFGATQGATFEGYERVDDCSSYQADYDWAEENVVPSKLT